MNGSSVVTGFLSAKFLYFFRRIANEKSVISNWPFVGSKTKWEPKFYSSSSTTVKITSRFFQGFPE